MGHEPRFRGLRGPFFMILRKLVASRRGPDMAPRDFKPDRWFPYDYAAARSGFLKAAETCRGHSRIYVHPALGPSGEEPATDVALLGSPGRQKCRSSLCRAHTASRGWLDQGCRSHNCNPACVHRLARISRSFSFTSSIHTAERSGAGSMRTVSTPTATSQRSRPICPILHTMNSNDYFRPCNRAD